MEHNDATQAFATLGQTGRLSVFRLLMRFAPQGVRPTDIAQSLGLKPNTLSHYLSDLTASGLVAQRREGRALYYAVNLQNAHALVSYLVLDLGRARPDLFPTERPAPMSDTAFKVLFICSGNSARSIFAEALMRDLGNGRFTAFSAGLHPNSQLNPFALEVLKRNGHATDGMRSKHISEFQTAEAPVMDFVFTVCDTSAAEECPPWPGQPITGIGGCLTRSRPPAPTLKRRLSLRRPMAHCAAGSRPLSNCPSPACRACRCKRRSTSLGRMPLKRIAANDPNRA